MLTLWFFVQVPCIAKMNICFVIGLSIRVDKPITKHIFIFEIPYSAILIYFYKNEYSLPDRLIPKSKTSDIESHAFEKPQMSKYRYVSYIYFSVYLNRN